jgi:CubicO group peptidase (beta-lactamase class C family)
MRNNSSALGVLIFISLSLFGCRNDQTHLDFVSHPEAGFNSEGLNELENFLDTCGSSAMILLYDGRILFEWGDTEKRLVVHSIRKPLLNSIFGIYVEKGIIDTNMTLDEINIDDIDPKLTETEKTARIADLLKSRSGIYHPAAAEAKSMIRSRPIRGSNIPDEKFYYNNWDFNTLGHIFELLSGKNIYTAFYEEIAVPLGMNHYSGEYTKIDLNGADAEIPDTDGFYQYEKDKSLYPAYHFRLSAYDLALFGQLYLNKGSWNNRKILSEEWIEASTKVYSIIDTNIGIGYGMLWRILMPNKERKTKSFFHTGNGIHMIGIYPASKLVFVHRVDTERNYNFPARNLYEIIARVFNSKK